MSDHFRPLDRDTLFMFPPSVQEWLPADHLARFIADIVAKLDMRSLRAGYAGRGVEAKGNGRHNGTYDERCGHYGTYGHNGDSAQLKPSIIPFNATIRTIPNTA